MTRPIAVERIRKGKRFLVTCHVRPDADALGSALGLAAVLDALGKECVVYSDGGVPPMLSFLEGMERVVDRVPLGETFDATFVMDAAARELVPELPEKNCTGPIVIVDHHAAHDGFGDLAVREIDACATGEVVLRMAHDLGLDPVPRSAAQPIYAAIVADTGGFRYAGTRAETHLLAAELLAQGVDPWKVASNLFERWQPARMSLLGEVLRAMTLEADGTIAFVCVDRAMMVRSRASDDMIEGMVNYGRMLEGVRVAVLLWEPQGKAGSEVKVSLRAGEGGDVSHVAVALGGGGHRSAAGASLAMDLATAREKVLAAAVESLGLPPAKPGSSVRPVAGK
jgi:phosphoesterase RecJ-like protein